MLSVKDCQADFNGGPGGWAGSEEVLASVEVGSGADLAAVDLVAVMAATVV